MIGILFASPIMLLQGAIAGFIFGFLLQKGKVTQANTIINQFLLKDHTMLKIMLTAILVGGVGVYTMQYLGLIAPLGMGGNTVLRVVLGAAIMGSGVAILGYCPGTCVAAAGQGSRDAWYGLWGMLIGAAVYAEVYPFLHKLLYSITPIKFTFLPQLFGIPAWAFFGMLLVILMTVKIVTESYK